MKRTIIRDAITGLFTRKERLQSHPETTTRETRYAWKDPFLALADEYEEGGLPGVAERIRGTVDNIITQRG